MRSLFLLGLFAVLLSTVGACGGSPVSPVPPTPTTGTATALATDLAISGPDVVGTGAQVSYKATARLTNGATISNISSSATWTTDNPSVATIDSNGVLTGQGPGSATITATYREKSTSATVRVLVTTAATMHLDALLEIMETYSIKRSTINWASFRAQVLAAAAAAKTIPETYPAVGLALRLLNDYESYFRTNDGGLIGPSPVGGCGAVTANAPRLPDTVGYVKVQGFSSEGSGDVTQFAESIQRAIRTADRTGLAGWIVDLRGNLGGNMWPMLAGIGPILGEGIVGYIVYNDREYEREYRAGAAQSFGETFARVRVPYSLLNEYPKVAVLTDGAVASAGEAIVVFFRGRLGTRSFGTPTCGHHHLLQQFPSSAGDLFLTTAETADRTKRKYGGPIDPDEIIADPGQVVNRASEWLQGGR